MDKIIRVTVWNEYYHEREMPEVKAIYPQGIHQVIAAAVNRASDMTARTAVLDEPEHGLTDQTLAETDVLLWWGHAHHEKVSDTVVEKVYNRVLQGMGLIVLHSGHASKIFRKLMGTDTQELKWREIAEKERIWVIEPGHPIADGLPEHFELEHEEMYGERFDIPTPDALVFISWFAGGEVFRSGCCFQRSRGKIFYFRPGHETFPIYHQPLIQKVLLNAIRWAAPGSTTPSVTGWAGPLEAIGRG